MNYTTTLAGSVILAIALPAFSQQRSLLLDGDDDYCVVSNSGDLQPPLAITIECWVEQSVSGPGRVISKGDGIRGTTDRSYDLSIIDQSSARGWFFFQDGRAASVEAPIATTGWHHIAITFSSELGVLALFIDGELASWTTHTAADDGNEPLLGKSIRQSSPAVHIGRQQGFPVWDIAGRMDRMRIWSSARSELELRCLIDVAIGPGEASGYPELLASWNWQDDGTDDAGNHDATLFGNAAFADSDDIPALGSDCNGNGTPDACDLLTGLSADVNQNGRPDECECVTISYCTSTANSSGQNARIDTLGDPSIVANGFYLQALGCPATKPGVFFYGAAATESPFGNGYLCVSGGGSGLFRLNPIAWTDGTGAVVRQLDFTQPPADSGPGRIDPFVTWYFQFWFRDPAAGGAFFNLTDGAAVTLCP